MYSMLCIYLVYIHVQYAVYVLCLYTCTVCCVCTMVIFYIDLFLVLQSFINMLQEYILVIHVALFVSLTLVFTRNLIISA